MQKDKGLLFIAIIKLVKGLGLLALGIGVLTLLHKDLAAEAAHWIEFLEVDPNNHYIHSLLARLPLLNPHLLQQISAGTFFYSALLLIEGVGLWLGKHWAEYFTVIVTGSFIPLEVYEIIKHVTPTRVGLLTVNVAVVGYLIFNLIRGRRQRLGGLARAS